MIGVDEEGLQALIGDVYDAAINPEKWQTFLDHLAGACRSGTGFYVQGPAGSAATVVAHANVLRATPDTYDTYYSKIKPWRAKLASAPEGAIMQISAMIDEWSLHRSAYYNEVMVPRDLYYSFACVLRRDGPMETTMSVGRSCRLGEYTASELKLVARLMPHLRRALAVHRRLVDAKLEQRALLHGLEGLGVGVILVAADGLVLFANGVANLILRCGDGLSIQRGRLHATTPALSNVLLRHVHDAAQAGARRGQNGGGALSLPRSAGGHLHLSVCPFPIETSVVIGPTTPVTVVFINAPAESLAIRQDVIRAFYGLSAAESKLVGALLEGMSVGDYADRNGIRVSTAKTQLLNIFAKTGQNRQADLVRHILSNVIARLASRPSTQREDKAIGHSTQDVTGRSDTV